MNQSVSHSDVLQSSFVSSLPYQTVGNLEFKVGATAAPLNIGLKIL